jgi:hypothetical protein
VSAFNHEKIFEGMPNGPFHTCFIVTHCCTLLFILNSDLGKVFFGARSFSQLDIYLTLRASNPAPIAPSNKVNTHHLTHLSHFRLIHNHFVRVDEMAS